MLEGALILLAGIVIGRFVPARRRKPKPPKPVKPICGCGHGFHDHGPQDPYACHARVSLGGSYRDCTCQRYAGPVPPEYFAPEISS